MIYKISLDNDSLVFESEADVCHTLTAVMLGIERERPVQLASHLTDWMVVENVNEALKVLPRFNREYNCNLVIEVQ